MGKNNVIIGIIFIGLILASTSSCENENAGIKSGFNINGESTLIFLNDTEDYLPVQLSNWYIIPRQSLELDTVVAPNENLDPKVNFNEIETDFMQWWTYHSNNISLSSNFIGLNEKSDTIDKEQFLKKLTSGDFIPLKLKSKDKIERYKLYKLDSLANKSIGSTIKNESSTNLKHFNMEGKTFPKFDFTDLNGNHFTNENTKGKTTIIKTWFIGCKACVAEFPELNELVENHKNGNDIFFVSLALDTKPELEKFLLKKPFKYQVVPEKKDFIEKKLNLQIYPTHIIVDENGTIIKVVNKASEMISFLEIEMKTIE